MEWEKERAQASIQAKGRVCMQVQLDRHSLGDLSMESFQLGVKGSHQLKHLLLGKECKGGKWKTAWTREVRRVEERDSALTWTATPKLFPSSIRGICSCNQVVTWEERMASKPHQPSTQFQSSCPSLLPAHFGWRYAKSILSPKA